MSRNDESICTVKSLEASFRFKNLNSDAADTLICRLASLTALDLSNNNIQSFPKRLPCSLIALDMSFNVFIELNPPENSLSNLKELRLRWNNINSIASLLSLTCLRYLDLSHNKLSKIEGLEALQQLHTLNLENNQIASAIAVRPLSINRCLSVLTLRGNPFSGLPQYRIMITNCIPSLIQLDGISIPQRKKLSVSAKQGYVEIFDGAKYDHRHRAPIPSECSIQTTQTESTPVTSTETVHLYYDGSDVVPARYDGDEAFRVPASRLPWRNPPNPMPRDVHGRPHMGAPIASKSHQVDVCHADINVHDSLADSQFPAARAASTGRSTGRTADHRQPPLREKIQNTSLSTQAPRRLLSSPFNPPPCSPNPTVAALEPIRWMTPELMRRPAAEVSRHDKTISEVINKIGLPDDMDSSTEFWSSRLAASRIAKVDSGASHNVPRPSQRAEGKSKCQRRPSSPAAVSRHQRRTSVAITSVGQVADKRPLFIDRSDLDLDYSAKLNDSAMSISEFSKPKDAPIQRRVLDPPAAYLPNYSHHSITPHLSSSMQYYALPPPPKPPSPPLPPPPPLQLYNEQAHHTQSYDFSTGELIDNEDTPEINLRPPLTIESCHVASAIEDLMARKMKTLQLINDAKSK